MQRWIYALVFALLSPILRAGDNPLVDSLKQELAQAETDSARGFWLSRLVRAHVISDTRLADVYNRQARELAEQRNDSQAIILSVFNDGLIHRFFGNHEKALDHLFFAKAFYERSGQQLHLSMVLFNLGVVYSLMGDYENSLNYYYQDRVLNEEMNNPYGMANSHNSIGIIHRKMGNPQKALDEYFLALDVFTELDRKWDMANVLLNIGGIYMDQNQDEQAKSHVLKALAINREIGERSGQAYNHHRLGVLYHKNGQLDSAAVHLSEALSIREESGQKFVIAETQLSYGVLLIEQGQSQRGFDLIRQSMALNEDIQALASLAEGHQVLAKYLSEAGNYRLAYQHQQAYTRLRDSVLNEEKLRVIEELEARYQTVKKDRLLAENQLELAENEAKIERQRLWIQIGVIGLIGVSVILGLVLVFFIQKKKLNDQKLSSLRKEQEIQSLRSMMKGEEQERSRIARDLHDGLSSLLAVIKLKFNSVQQEWGPFQGEGKFEEAMIILDQANKEVRRIAHNMMPEILLKFGLDEAIREFITSLNEVRGVQFEYVCFGEECRLGRHRELVLYRVIQELVNNIIKHSGATEAIIQLNQHEDKLTVTVEDNGIGFDPENLNQPSGLGMSNLRSRVEFLNGDLHFSSFPGQGTSVYIEIELDPLTQHT